MIRHKFVGMHVFADFYGVSPKFLIKSSGMHDIFMQAISVTGATLCDLSYKDFKPQGFTMLGLLSESHTSVHTYPEYRSLFIDAFTCGETCDPVEFVKALKQALQPTGVKIHTVPRGQTQPHTVPDALTGT